MPHDRVFGPVRKCIYCKATGVDLITEHPMPAQIGGDIALEEASCDICKLEIDSQFETKCLSWWTPIRFRRRMARRKHKDFLPIKAKMRQNWSSIIPMKTINRPLKEWDFVQVDFEKHPASITMAYFRAPGFFRNVTPEQSGGDFYMRPWVHNEQVKADPRYSEITYRAHFDPIPFGRLVAKILHGIAVMSLGVDGFEPFLTDIIRGKDLSKFWYYIGGNPLWMPPSDTPLQVALWTGDPASLKPEQPNYIFGHLRLFGNLGAPVFYALIGQIPKDGGSFPPKGLSQR